MSGTIPLIKTRVLYLGSSIPLQTSLGLEAIQQPLKDRYGGVDGSSKVSGIDSILTVYSGGIMLEYVDDASATTWFPIQSMHLCCSVTAQREAYDMKFKPINGDVKEPPIFAAITRRPKGVRVLECHAFLCRHVETCLALTQSCTHAFKHREGWMTSDPPIGVLKQIASKLIPAENVYEKNKGGVSFPFNKQPTNYCLEAKKEVTETQQQVVVIPSNEPPPIIQVVNPPIPPQPIIMPPQNLIIPPEYFSNWQESANQTYLVIPDQKPPPQPCVVEQPKKEKKKKKKKENKKEKKESVEYFIMRRDAVGDEEEDDKDDDSVEEFVIYPNGINQNGEEIPDYGGGDVGYGGNGSYDGAGVQYDDGYYNGSYDGGYNDGYSGGSYSGGYDDGGYVEGRYANENTSSYAPQYYDGQDYKDYPEQYTEYYKGFL